MAKKKSKKRKQAVLTCPGCEQGFGRAPVSQSNTAVPSSPATIRLVFEMCPVCRGVRRP